MIIGGQRPLDRSTHASARACIYRIDRIESVWNRGWGARGIWIDSKGEMGVEGACMLHADCCTCAHRCSALLHCPLTTLAGPSVQAREKRHTIQQHSSESRSFYYSGPASTAAAAARLNFFFLPIQTSPASTQLIRSKDRARVVLSMSMSGLDHVVTTGWVPGSEGFQTHTLWLSSVW